VSPFRDEYERVDGKIVPKEDEFAADQVKGLLEIGYDGHLGYELCHPLPLVDGQLPRVDFVDDNVGPAAEYMRQTVSSVKRQGSDEATRD
jgi:hypothetical protein